MALTLMDFHVERICNSADTCPSETNFFHIVQTVRLPWSDPFKITLTNPLDIPYILLQLFIIAKLVVHRDFLVSRGSIQRIYPFLLLYKSDINIFWHILRWKKIIFFSAFIIIWYMKKEKGKIKAQLISCQSLIAWESVFLPNCCLFCVLSFDQCNKLCAPINYYKHKYKQTTNSSRPCLIAVFAFPYLEIDWFSKLVDRLECVFELFHFNY